ncbi:TraR/DksA family transcriptional regulator [Alteromonas facilis]|uniref:TraR/DksA family transcriptional regulator n=1 Tax=Alteromonas facilis TaxID=2048004 RepID=UPI000C2821A1|nr:TraR/DksA C4-type zinc finger protein [Alteromonas facilis]
MSQTCIDYGAILSAKQSELLSRIDALKHDIAKAHSADFAEQVTERENDDVLHNLVHEATVELHQVNDALDRLARDEYGVCAKCGVDISQQRLQVIPYTQFCRDCAQ